MSLAGASTTGGKSYSSGSWVPGYSAWLTGTSNNTPSWRVAPGLSAWIAAVVLENSRSGPIFAPDGPRRGILRYATRTPRAERGILMRSGEAFPVLKDIRSLLLIPVA
jgi:hypothetical protein